MTRDAELEALKGHTPGPWARCVDSHSPQNGKVHAWVEGPESVDFRHIADMCGADEQARADVSIIAAAPDLLRELIEARRLLREAMPKLAGSPLDHTKDRIRAFLDGETKT